MPGNFDTGYAQAGGYPLDKLLFYPDPENDFQLGWNKRLVERHTEASKAAKQVKYTISVEIDSFAGPGETLEIFSELTRKAAKRSSLHLGRMKAQKAQEGEWA